jgi:hypothetical protein
MLRKYACGIVMSAFVLTITVPAAIAGPTRAAPSHARSGEQIGSQQVAPYDEGEARLNSIGSVLEGIRIGAPTMEEFRTLYNRHKREIQTIVNQHMDLVWETIDLAIDALPALRSTEKTGGRLFLDKGIYSRANRLFEKYMALAGSGLAKDLRRAKRFIDGKTEDWNSNQVMIDLND